MISLSYLDIFFFTVGVSISIYIYGRWKYSYFVGTGVKYLDPPIVFLGNGYKTMLGIAHMQDYISEVYNSFPGERYIGIFESQRPQICIRDLELIKKIGIKDFDNFHDHRIFIDIDLDPFFGRNLFSLKGNKWRDMRTTLSPVFSSSKMRNMFAFIDDCAKQMAAYYSKQIEISDKGQIDIEVKDIFSRYTNDAIASAAFGLNVNSFENRDNEFYKLGRMTCDFSFGQIFKVMVFTVIPKIIKLLNITFMSSKVMNYFKNLVLTTMKNREENNTVRLDMIHLLMEAKKGSLVDDANPADHSITGFATVQESNVRNKTTKTKWTDEDLIAQTVLFIIGGLDTTSSLLTFFAYEMVRHPEIRKKLQKEFDDFERQHEGKFVYNDLQDLKYLDMTISETLRMWPPGTLLDRVCSKPYTLPPPSNSTNQTYQIKSMESVIIPVYGIHHDPQYFPEPERFDPERFSDENKASIDPMAYLPFGIGPRNCIGSRYALMVAKVIIFQMLSKFDFVATEKTEIPVKLKNVLFNLHPKNGLWVGLRKRSNKI